METQISIPETLGCIELGIILSAMIYGLMCVQCYNYHQLGFKDKMYIHLLVRASLKSSVKSELKLSVYR